MGSILGTMLGALILISLAEVLRAILPQGMFTARYLLYGLILVLMMRWRPAGIIPFRKAQESKAERIRQRLASSASKE
jgi:branched-chain amino acid transport system permease protein